MPFKKRALCSNISLIISAGLLLSSSVPTAQAQLPQYTCIANAAGDGWVCESTISPAAGATATPVKPSSELDPAPPETSAPPIATPETPPVDTPLPAAPIPEVPAPEIPATSNSTAKSLPSADLSTATTSALADLEEPAPATATLRTTPSAVVAAFSSGHALDWVPREAMGPAQLQTLADNCCGAYIDPTTGAVDLEADPAEAEIRYRSIEGLTQISRNLITIEGDIVVQQGFRTIQNNAVTSIDPVENTVLMEGDVVFREPGVLLRGNSAYIDSNDGVSRLESAHYVLHDYGAHGQADSIVYHSNSGLVSIENGEFSRCEPDSTFWYLRANTIVLDQEQGRGYAQAVSLRLGNIPVFYYPFTLQFPLGDERISGFLAPSTGSTRSGGFDFELPYYLNLAPHYDATISPRLISDRGVMISAELRYLSSWSMNTLNMSHLRGDKLFDPATAKFAGSDSPPTENRWFIGYEHLGVLNRNWTTYVDYSAVSDADYFYDLGSTGLNVTSRTHLNRQGRLNFNSPLLRAGLNLQRIQIIDPFLSAGNLNRPYDRLPQFFFDTDVYLAGGFRIGLSGEITSFDRDLDESLLSPASLNNGALVHGERLNLEPEISWSLEAPGWFLRAKMKYKHVAYRLQNQAANTVKDPDLGIGVYSFDSGLIFERPMSRGGGGWTQTLEPRLYYLYSEFQDQSMLPLFDTSELNFSFSQLFREDRFSGGDRSADADQITLALTTRLLDSTGKERARLSVGQIQYFEDRRVTMNNPLQTWLPRYSPVTNRSALAAEFGYSFGDNWRLHGDVQWNQDTREVDEGSFQLRYQSGSNRLFNLAYRYRSLLTTRNLVLPSGIDPRIKQTDISAAWPLSENWKLLVRWNYDHSNSRNLESFAGVEYSNCCATIRLIGREWVDEDELFLPNIKPNRGIFVQFTLHGLGNITGGGLSNLLRDGILGFREPDYE